MEKPDRPKLSGGLAFRVCSRRGAVIALKFICFHKSKFKRKIIRNTVSNSVSDKNHRA